MPLQLPDPGDTDLNPTVIPPPGDPSPRGRGKHVVLDSYGGLTDASVEKWLPFTFQVPPLENFPINRSFPHTDYETIEAGQRSRPGAVQLQQITLRTFFTSDIPRFALLHGPDYKPDPMFMLEKLEFIGEAQTPIFLSARNTWMGSRFDYAGPVTLRSLNSEEVHGEPDTRYVTLEFSEWKPTSISVRRVGGPGSDWVPSSHPRGSSRTVSVLTGRLDPSADTLHKLAQQFYGDPSEWRRIAQANGLAVPPSYDLNLLSPSRKLLLPRR